LTLNEYCAVRPPAAYMTRLPSVVSSSVITMQAMKRGTIR